MQGGQSFAQVGGKTVNQGLRGPGCDISAVSVPLVNTTQAKNYFGYDWKPCRMPTAHGNWASEPTAANRGTFQLLEKEPAGRVSWLNASIQAMPATQCQGKPCFLEGSAAGAGSRCDGAPDYADAPCGSTVSSNYHRSLPLPAGSAQSGGCG